MKSAPGLSTKFQQLVFHPFLFAAFPVIASLDHAKRSVLPQDGLSMLVAVELFAAVIFAAFWLLLKNPPKAGLAASLFICMWFCFRVFQVGLESAVESMIHRPPAAWFSLLVFFSALAVLIVAVLKDNWNFGTRVYSIDQQKLLKGLNIAASFVLALNLIPYIWYQVQLIPRQQQLMDSFRRQVDGVSLDASTAKPDIYYIILDACANSRTLKSIWGYDNHHFIDFLERRGFYVVPQPFSNYDRTVLSLSSILNMQYLDQIRDRVGREYEDETLYHRLIQNNSVMSLLRRLGYRIVNFSTGFSADDDFPDAINIRCRYASNFNIYLLMLTPLAATESYYPFLRDMLADMYLCPDHRLNDVIRMPGPKFVFLHANFPHPPFLFDEKGNRLPLMLLSNLNYSMPQLYLAQVKFAEAEAEKWITAILQDRASSPVIILQSDHGPLFPMPDRKNYVNERLRILNAIYFNGLKKDDLYKSMSSVNTFRLLFNDYFHAGLPVLPDRAFYAPSDTKGLDGSDVTSQLEF